MDEKRGRSTSSFKLALVGGSLAAAKDPSPGSTVNVERSRTPHRFKLGFAFGTRFWIVEATQDAYVCAEPSVCDGRSAGGYRYGPRENGICAQYQLDFGLSSALTDFIDHGCRDRVWTKTDLAPLFPGGELDSLQSQTTTELLM